jgi:CRP-like cAMP-binding protein
MFRWCHELTFQSPTYIPFTHTQSYQPADGLYVVVSGAIHVVGMNQQIIKTLRAGDVFGQFSLLGPLLMDSEEHSQKQSKERESRHSLVGMTFDADLSAQVSYQPKP